MTVRQRVSAALATSPLWQRWQRLPARDRLALLLLGAFLLAVTLYFSVWQPAQRTLAEAREHYQQQRALHAYLEQNAELARQMSRAPAPNLAPGQLQGLVTATAQQQGLTVESLEIGADGRLSIRLPEAPADTLLGWLAALQAQGVRLDEASLERVADGVVNARVTLAGAP